MFTDQVKVYFYSFVSKFPISSSTISEGSPPVSPPLASAPNSTNFLGWFFWPFALVYLLILLLFNNLNPFISKHCLVASLVQYLLQGVPLVFGLTGLGPCAALF